MMTTLKVSCLNCRGLGNRQKRQQIFNFFHQTAADVILLQETHTTIDSANRYKREWKRLSSKHRSYWNSVTSMSCGVAVLIADASALQYIDSKYCPEGRSLTVKVKVRGNTIQFLSVYAPTVPEVRPQYFENLNRFTFPDALLITGGDFNMVQNVDLDRSGGTITAAHTKGLQQLLIFQKQQDIKDVWREKNPTTHQYSWSSPDMHIHSRLDRFYISSQLQHDYIRQDLTHNTWSDHRTLSLYIRIDKQEPRGEGYWKLNTEYLKDPQYTTIINNLITEWNQQLTNFESFQKWWTDLKTRVKFVTIEYSTQKKRERNEKVKALQKYLHIENQKERPDKQYIIDTQIKIAKLKQFKHQGAMIRSREQVIINGERPTRYFYAQEKIRKYNSTIQKLNLPQNDNHTNNENIYEAAINSLNNNTETDGDKILEHIRTYFANLYKKQTLDENLQDELLKDITRKLPRHMKEMIDANISKEELTQAKEAATTNTSPGIDGLPIEWYITFWDQLAPHILTFANDIYNNGLEQDAQQRLSLIRLIHKRGDKDDLENWRPISLLCVDYKLVAKVLSSRLKKALPHIIEEDQTCGILGRSIFQNLYTIRDTIAYTNDHKIPTYIISFDFQKAFDKVDHSFLYKALKAFNFGNKYTTFVQLTNAHCFARIMNNGRFTRDVPLQRSVKQGDHESMQFFDIIAEILAIQIRKNTNINGLRLPGKTNQLKLSLYADDNNSIVTTQNSIVHLYRELKRFEMASGCNINESKTQGLLVGGAL